MNAVERSSTNELVQEQLAYRTQSIIDQCFFPGYHIFARAGHGGVYLQASFIAEDCRTGEREEQLTRKWNISPSMTKSEVVQTAFKLVLTAGEHEVREQFKYRGKAIFGPHFNIDTLHTVCDELDRRETQ